MEKNSGSLGMCPDCRFHCGRQPVMHTALGLPGERTGRIPEKKPEKENGANVCKNFSCQNARYAV